MLSTEKGLLASDKDSFHRGMVESHTTHTAWSQVPSALLKALMVLSQMAPRRRHAYLWLVCMKRGYPLPGCTTWPFAEVLPGIPVSLPRALWWNLPVQGPSLFSILFHHWLCPLQCIKKVAVSLILLRIWFVSFLVSFFILLYIFTLLFWDKISHNPGWPSTCCVGRPSTSDWPSLSKCRDCRFYAMLEMKSRALCMPSMLRQQNYIPKSFRIATITLKSELFFGFGPASIDTKWNGIEHTTNTQECPIIGLPVIKTFQGDFSHSLTLAIRLLETIDPQS